MWLFHGLSALAMLAFAAGVARRVSSWLGDGHPRAVLSAAAGAALRRGATLALKPSSLRALILDGLVFRRLWRASRYRWLIHFGRAWSFAGLFLIGSLGDLASQLGAPFGRDTPWFAATNDSL
ncbi:MAG: hypothetical protein KGJ86_01045, partial [Chloroflexota bacterium]|nr:hypothetical protein [Chloroflexota bacterium]